MYNIEIREALRTGRVFAYEVAAKIGMSEFSFSRKLSRGELSEPEKARIMAAIREIRGESRC